MTTASQYGPPVFGRLSEAAERDACIADEINLNGMVWFHWHGRIRDVLNRAKNNHRRRAKLRGLIQGYVRAIATNIKNQKSHEGAIEELLVIEVAFAEALEQARLDLDVNHRFKKTPIAETAA